MKVRIGNKELIKDINKNLVINEIRMNEPISRTDISKNLNLGLSTVTNIIDDLESQGLVLETGEANSTGGRKPILLELNAAYGNIISIKLEENKVVVALTDLKTKVIEKKVRRFKKNSSSDYVINISKELIRDLLKEYKLEEKLIGIGIAVSGLVDKKNGNLIYSGLLNWKDVNISESFKEEFKVPVFIENDVNVYALAELWCGIGKNLNNFLLITCGAGIGSGIVINKKIYSGDFGGAGEIGHTVLVVDGRQCECGQKGCLEAYASDHFIEEFILENKEKYPNSNINIDEELSIESVYEAAKTGDLLAIDAIKTAAKYLGYGVLSAINLLNPSTIILAGEGMAAKDIIMPIIKEIAYKNFFSDYMQKVRIEASSLGNEAWDIGGAVLVMSNLFALPIYEENNDILKVK